jgi:hypothetical protein
MPAVFDGKEQSALPLGLTINSALQYLTSFAKLAFVAPIIDGLGQLKWLWFASRPRPLLDFQLYEKASRDTQDAATDTSFSCVRTVLKTPSSHPTPGSDLGT